MSLTKITILGLNILFLAAFFTACANDAPTATNGETAATPVEYGINIYQKNCVSCHGAEGNMGFNGAYDLSKSALSLAERIAVITNGRKTMTPFKALLSGEEIKKVAEYTETLKK
jgi:cytochrome c6